VNDRFARIGAIVAADFRIRFRRVSTLVVFILLSGVAYLWVPSPSTGRALLEISGQRALYNSAAVGMATAMLASIFVGMVGFYVISNAIRRDVMSRCGQVIASTTVTKMEYLLGKLAGNVVFLTTFVSGFMLTAMAMVIVRGEAPLQPWVFAWQYLLLVPPAIGFVSAAAILFESVPFLSGRLGDIVYFFLWASSIGVVAGFTEKRAGRPGLAELFDYSGFAFLFATLKHALHTTRLSIGATPFDPSKGVFVFHGLVLPPEWILPRLASTVTPLILVALAALFFHRFDPVRLRRSVEKSHRSWIARINALLKPLTRGIIGLLAVRGSGVSLLSAARTDALTTISAFPIISLGIVGIAIASLVSNAPELLTAIMPIAFGAAGLAIADVACREKRTGTLALVRSTPMLRERFVGWKLLTSVLVAMAFLLIPMIRAALLRPSTIVPLIIGLLFVCAAATALGIVSANPKTFLVLFLSFWYVVMNDKGATPSLDFADFFGKTTPAVMVAYGSIAIAFVVAAQAFHSRELRRT
jgi:hypothetical protein